MAEDDEDDGCPRCGEARATTTGLCHGCEVAAKREAAEGLEELDAYLARWASFREWESG